jgi:hypothetical protein
MWKYLAVTADDSRKTNQEFQVLLEATALDLVNV